MKRSDTTSKMPTLDDISDGFARVESKFLRVDTISVHPDDVAAFLTKVCPRDTGARAKVLDGAQVGWLWGASVKTEASIDRSRPKVIRLVSDATSAHPQPITVWV